MSTPDTAKPNTPKDNTYLIVGGAFIIFVIMICIIIFLAKRLGMRNSYRECQEELENATKELENVRNEEIKYFQELKVSNNNYMTLSEAAKNIDNIISIKWWYIPKEIKEKINEEINKIKEKKEYTKKLNDLINKYVETLPLNKIYSINKKIKTDYINHIHVSGDH